MNPSGRLRVGVIGCGGIARIMHLPHLSALRRQFEIVALSDLSPGVLAAMGDLYHIPAPAQFTDYRDLIAQKPDVVFVLTGGNHYQPALDALRAGIHVFSEKPMCYSVQEADALVQAAEQSKVKLMVGYMKRHDPGYLWAQQRVKQMTNIRYAQINTLHPSEDGYLKIYDLARFADIPAGVLASLQVTEDEAARRAVGDVSREMQSLYVGVFLGSMVHDTNALRGLLGEPERVLFSEHWGPVPGSTTTVLQYGSDLRVVFTWTYLEELRDYFEEIAILSDANRLRIQFPSPYLKHFPTPIVFQGMENEAAFETEVTASYEEAFKQELIALYDSIIHDKKPLTDGRDARGDIVLLQQIFAALHPEGLGGEAAAYVHTVH